MPKKWFVHGWWVVPNKLDPNQVQKIGKSLGNASSPIEMVHKFGLDTVKYYLLSEASPEGDCQISDELVIAKLNADLNNALGNLLNRCVMEKIIPEQKVPVLAEIDQLIKGEKVGSVELIFDIFR